MWLGMSQPSWAAWIEILRWHYFPVHPCESQPSWAAWIEIIGVGMHVEGLMSQPSWAAWIEIFPVLRHAEIFTVAALLGCVD